MVTVMNSGDRVGEMEFLDDGDRSIAARATERSTVLVLPYAPIWQATESNPKLLFALVRLLVARLRQTDHALGDAMFLDVSGRPAKQIIEPAGGPDEFISPLTQEELAGLTGTSRERVNKTLATFVGAS